ncbi:hypothetical protein AGDE_14880 [Angomonas deanei]|nr:hypothetical protein AGDE_14880 [Angomonas deanei]|eukprot:EPY20061.1 hypothetical protein AGDE_14880 [Angomonas deanei]
MRRTMNNTANSSTLNSSQVYSPLFHGSFTSSSIKELGDGKETDSSTSGSQNKLKEGQKKEGKRMNTSAVEVDEKEPKKEKGDQSDSSALRRTDRRRPPSNASEDATNPLLKSNCTMKDLQVHSVESTQDREEEEDTSTPTVPRIFLVYDRPTNPC